MRTATETSKIVISDFGRKILSVTVNGLRRIEHTLLSFAGVNLRAIVPWITLRWQHQQLYGKAYLYVKRR